MLALNVEYRSNTGLGGRWWYAVVEQDRLKRVIDTLFERPCANSDEAYCLGNEALHHIQNERNASDESAE